MTLIQNFKNLFTVEPVDPPTKTNVMFTFSNTSSMSPTTTHPHSAPVSPSQGESSRPSFSFSGSLSDQYPDLPSHYRLISVLGEGAFSTVYKAVDTKQNDLTVAIKVINKANLSAKQYHNIKNEILIMKRASAQPHPNIIKLLHSVNTHDHCFLVLEYCNGGEIFNKIIEYTYFSEPLSRHVFKQLVSAIDHLHKNDIVHRDIKPENLLFLKIPYFARSTEEFKSVLRKSDDGSKVDEGEFQPSVGGGTIGIIKLADFGLAKQLMPRVNSSTNLKTPCGTAGYTAPEVITCNSSDGGKKKLFFNNASKKNYYSKSVDIWSLGCLLYTILCGFPPFYDDDSNQLTTKIINGDFVFLKPWWDEISNEAKDLITRMLNTDPEERITVEEIWQHPWVRGSNGTPYPKQVVEEEDVPQHYFEAVEQKYEVMHIENNESDKSDPDHLTFKLPNQPLQSPRAQAIRKVFDNHAIMESLEQDEEDSKNIQYFAYDEEEEEEEPEFIENVLSKGEKHKVYPKSPNPISLNFKDVFSIKKSAFSHGLEYSDDEDDDADDDNDEDSELEDQVTSLNPTEFSGLKRKSSTKATPMVKSALGSGSDSYSGGIKSPDVEEDEFSSANSSSENDLDYQTRSSSIISGINGEFKFTLSLNDSNLITRRRSSTISRSLKKHSSNTSSTGSPATTVTSTIVS
ncbi:hypothetical protein G9P44_004994 [Scheffersomyces stipitis]|nr:hypothetical protein G9P44_004994 [Scheffersomyces stipitis]